MNDGYALLRAIEANPDEDTPRLAYADWLDENTKSDSDRARAEFIRVQCELARTPNDDPRLPELNIRERNAVAPYCSVWVKELGAGYAGGLRFERGFLATMCAHGLGFAQLARHLAAVAPLHILSFRGLKFESIINEVATSPFLRCVRNLDLSEHDLNDLSIEKFAVSAHVVNVRSLDLSGNKGGVAACEALAASFPALRELMLTRNPIQDPGLATIRQAPWFPSLEQLTIEMCGISEGGIIALAADPNVSNLRRLRVEAWSGHHWGDAAARAILDSPYLQRLERLAFEPNNMSAAVRAELETRFGKRWFRRGPFA